MAEAAQKCCLFAFRAFGARFPSGIPIDPDDINDDQNEPEEADCGHNGSDGHYFGVRLLELLQGSEVGTHLILSKWARRTLLYETKYTLEQVQEMATEFYPLQDQGAAISSGSFVTSGMVVVPCSMRSLSAIAHGAGDNLIPIEPPTWS